jgi:hypothetical protein
MGLETFVPRPEAPMAWEDASGGTANKYLDSFRNIIKDSIFDLKCVLVYKEEFARLPSAPDQLTVPQLEYHQRRMQRRMKLLVSVILSVLWKITAN